MGDVERPRDGKGFGYLTLGGLPTDHYVHLVSRVAESHLGNSPPPGETFERWLGDGGELFQCSAAWIHRPFPPRPAYDDDDRGMGWDTVCRDLALRIPRTYAFRAYDQQRLWINHRTVWGRVYNAPSPRHDDTNACRRDGGSSGMNAVGRPRCSATGGHDRENHDAC